MDEDNIHKGKEAQSQFSVLYVVFALTTGAVLFAMMLWHTFIPIAEHRDIDITGVAFSFIGVLATFIVIGNYTQVTDVRNEMRKELKDIQHDYFLLKNNLDSSVQSIEKGIETQKLQLSKAITNIEQLEQLKADFQKERRENILELSDRNTRLILDTFGEFLQLPKIELEFFKKIYDKQDGINIQIELSDKITKAAVVKIEDSRLVVVEGKQSIPIAMISKINGRKTNLSRLSILLDKLRNANSFSQNGTLDGNDGIGTTPTMNAEEEQTKEQGGLSV